MGSSSRASSAPRSRAAIRFVVLLGIVSLFADFTYEGARSVVGSYFAVVGASATIVGVVTGFGEFLGYAIRLVSGRWADLSRRFWPIVIFGYVLQMAAVPALAFTSSWPAVAVLIVLERVGKAIRTPPRDVMLSHAGQQAGGLGWVFGVHQSLDQLGAMIGPLAVAAVLSFRHNYQLAFAVLAVPAVFNLFFLGVARLTYPRPQEFDDQAHLPQHSSRLPTTFWVYVAAAALVAAGFADYPLIAYHFSRTHVVAPEWVAVFYAVAMAVAGSGSLVFGRMFDRHGFKVLIVLTLLGAAYAPLAFLGGFWTALGGAALWGLGMGVHESIIPAAVAPMASRDRRATAYGLFTAIYGFAWFVGSAVIGFLYDRTMGGTIAFCVAAELAAIPLLFWVSRAAGRSTSDGHVS